MKEKKRMLAAPVLGLMGCSVMYSSVTLLLLGVSSTTLSWWEGLEEGDWDSPTLVAEGRVILGPWAV